MNLENGVKVVVTPPSPSIVMKPPVSSVALVPVAGPAGRLVGAPLYVGSALPADHPAAYMWLQTGLGDDGSDWTLIFDDGS